jgi:dTMP kinase
MSGFFLVVEGPEGAGKSTLVAALAQHMRVEGIEPILVREPGGTSAAEAIRRVLLDPAYELGAEAELFLFLAARADLVARVIAPALAQGQTVLADRFELSTVAYQIGGRGLDEQRVRTANALATGGLSPDLTLVLDVSAGTGFDRIRNSGQGFDRIEREPREFHDRVAHTFRSAVGNGIVHLDAEQGRERVLLAAIAQLAAHRPKARLGG